MINRIGWVATAVFAVSYFCRQPAAMRRIQASRPCCGIGYGVIIKAPPVIVANVVVAAMAIISSSASKTTSCENLQTRKVLAASFELWFTQTDVD